MAPVDTPKAKRASRWQHLHNLWGICPLHGLQSTCGNLMYSPGITIVQVSLVLYVATWSHSQAGELPPDLHGARYVHIDPSTHPPTLTSDTQRRRLDNFVHELMACRHIPGLSLSVVVDDTLTLETGYGLADMDSGEYETADSVVCIASLSKAFTSVLLGKLLLRTNFTWQTKLVDIPGLNLQFYDDYVTTHMTILDLLLHRTGIPRYEFTWFSGNYDRHEILSHLPYMKPADEFRHKAMYNNIMYMLAGHVAETIGGKSWQQLLTEEILQPLGMTQTTFFFDDRETWGSYSRQYTMKKGLHIPLDYTKYSKGMKTIAPAIAVCSTATDMTKWMKFLLYKGKAANGVQLIPESTMADIMHPQIQATELYYSQIKRPRTPVSYVLDGYALGWFTGYYRGLPVLSHYGSFPGSFSHITLLPMFRIGVFSSINYGDQELPYTINSLLHTYIIDLILGENPWIESDYFQSGTQEICYFPNDASSNVRSDDITIVPSWHELDAYVGTYCSKIYGQITIWINTTLHELPNDGQGVLFMSYGEMEFILHAQEARDANTDVYLAVLQTLEFMVEQIEVYFKLTTSTSRGLPVVTHLEVPAFQQGAGESGFFAKDSETHPQTRTHDKRCTTSPSLLTSSSETSSVYPVLVFIMVVTQYCILSIHTSRFSLGH